MLKEHPEIQAFVSKLERKIVDNPERGAPDSAITTNGRSIPCIGRLQAGSKDRGLWSARKCRE
jgi:hypothetical protein